MVDYTNITNMTNPGQLIDFVNQNTFNAFGTFTVLAIFFILLVVMKQFDVKKAFTSACLMTLLFSILFLFGGWVNFILPLAFLILTGGSIFVQSWSKG